MSKGERDRMLTALAFIPDRTAAEGMLHVALNGPADLRGMATWWCHHRSGNDWREHSDLREKFPEQTLLVAAKSKQKKAKLPNLKRYGKPVFESSLVEAGETIAIGADVTGARRLVLVVTDGDGSISSDWADWIEPCLEGPMGSVKLTSLAWTSAYSDWGSVRKGRNVNGGPMKVAGQAIADGIGTHAASVIVFDIAGKGFTRFTASGGIDDEKADSPGSVKFRIYLQKKLPAQLKITDIEKLRGDASRGAALFISKKANCSACHTLAGKGGQVGPDLSLIAKKYPVKILLESLLDPAAAITQGYEVTQVLTTDGLVIIGFVIGDGEELLLKDSMGKQHRIAKEDIEIRRQLKTSLMPSVTSAGLKPQDLADLIELLKQAAEQSGPEKKGRAMD